MIDISQDYLLNSPLPKYGDRVRIYFKGKTKDGRKGVIEDIYLKRKLPFIYVENHGRIREIHIKSWEVL